MFSQGQPYLLQRFSLQAETRHGLSLTWHSSSPRFSRLIFSSARATGGLCTACSSFLWQACFLMQHSEAFSHQHSFSAISRICFPTGRSNLHEFVDYPLPKVGFLLQRRFL